MKFTEEKKCLLVSHHPLAAPVAGRREARVPGAAHGLQLVCRAAGPGEEGHRLDQVLLPALCSLHQLFPAGGWLTARPTRSQKSYCEMLLLTAIHFHAGQLSAVADLVCQTTGIKMTVRTNGMARIKRITIITEIFTESVVAAHAIKVIVMRLWCLWSSYSNGPF